MPDKNPNSFPYKICYVEDSGIVSRQIKPAIETLLGADVDWFSTTNKALEVMEKEGFGKWGVFIIDNRTGHGAMSGIELAKRVRREAPEAIVVSLNSSDLGEIRDFGLEELHGRGIEFWYKMTESLLMIPWIADCIKEGKMIPRTEWLESIGEPSGFLIEGLDPNRETEMALRNLCWGRREGIDPALRGILMERDVKEYLQEISGGHKGIERK